MFSTLSQVKKTAIFGNGNPSKKGECMMTDEGRRQDKGPNIIPPEYATRSVDLLDIVGFTLKYHGGLRLGYQ